MTFSEILQGIEDGSIKPTRAVIGVAMAKVKAAPRDRAPYMAEALDQTVFSALHPIPTRKQ